MFKFLRLICRVHVYATEDPEKVKKAVQNLLSDASYSVKKTRLEGHFGDPITVYEYSVEDERDAESIFQRVVSAVGFGSVGVEEKPRGGGKLHVRVDKQKAFLGELVAEDVDPVKLEFSYLGDWREAKKWLKFT
ncbi:MAG: RNA-binding domain-containing protein [Candidatus Caldarchaeum sp.]|nr:hypothetical protein [Candidatus Caldarchaeum sp.]MDW8062778.1 RNA-binding domain-containing protein [Candidatus Caldarchaeum sp.]